MLTVLCPSDLACSSFHSNFLSRAPVYSDTIRKRIINTIDDVFTRTMPSGSPLALLRLFASPDKQLWPNCYFLCYQSHEMKNYMEILKNTIGEKANETFPARFLVRQIIIFERPKFNWFSLLPAAVFAALMFYSHLLSGH